MKNVEDIYPLSPTQLGMLFHSLEDPDSDVYHEQLSFKISEHLDPVLLKKAWESVIERHPILRTAFIWEEIDHPVQVVRGHVEINWFMADWRGISAEEQHARLNELLKADRNEGFNLENAPLHRINLIQLEENVFFFLLSFHHAVLDRWSVDLVLDEVFNCYRALMEGRPLSVSEPTPFREYIFWILNQSNPKTYWKEYLRGFTDPSLLARSVNASAIQEKSQTFHTREIHFSPVSVEAMVELVRTHQMTLNTLIIGVWGLVISRFSGLKDVLFGATVSTRPPELPNAESIVGLFINTLPVRILVEKETSILDWLQQIMAEQVLSQEYAHSSLVEIQAVSEIPRGRPLFDCLVVFENIGISSLSESNRHTPVIEDVKGHGRAHYPLSLIVTPGDQLFVQLRYRTDRFDALIIQRYLEHFRVLLEGIVTNPFRNLASLEPLVPEYQSVPATRVAPSDDFNSFEREEINQSIPDRFEKQVNLFPDHVAVHTRVHKWTYLELNQRANAIARTLLSDSPHVGERVGLLFDHGAPMIAAILGVLKAGKTYVPLDPVYPDKRLAVMVADTGIQTILTDALNLGRANLLAAGERTVQQWDVQARGEEADSLIEDSHPIRSPGDKAYILYTSGSTGQPKGVVQTHRNVLHFIRVYTNNLCINPNDRVTLFSSFGFDAAVMDIFGALLNGATLYPWNMRKEGLSALGKWMDEKGITIYHSTPSVFRYVSSELQEKKLNQVRLVVLGGEEVRRREADLFKKHFSSKCVLVNGFGPTESTISMQYFLNGKTQMPDTVVPVGYPVDETDILLLNEDGDVTPVYGEIGIRSRYLALEYWRNPTLTQSAFLPDPDGGERRIYRTGDLARRLADGSLEYVSRNDNQVKIRGFRIELREIELALESHPSVQQSVVKIEQNQLGEKHIVAYIKTVAKEAFLNPLRHYLQGKLPSYMVPTSFYFIDSFPLTQNGKIDYRALPGPEEIILQHKTAYCAPRNAEERLLVTIWSDLLKEERVSVRDNFFDLGGHSLLAITMFNRIEKEIGIKLPIATLFKTPVLEDFANVIKRGEKNVPIASSLVPVQPNGINPPVFNIHYSFHTPLSAYRLAEQLGKDQPFYLLHAPDQASYEGDLREMAERCVKDMRTIAPNGPYYIVAYCRFGMLAYEIARQLSAQGEKIALLALLDVNYSKYTSDQPISPVLNRTFGKRFTRLHNKVNPKQTEASSRSSNGKLKYLFRGIYRSLKKLPQRIYNGYELYIKVKIWERAIRYYQSEGKTLPAYLFKDSYIVYKATKEYEPLSYKGKVTLFVSADFRQKKVASDLGWGHADINELEVHHLPTSHMMLREPHVKVVGVKLKSCLTSAQEDLKPIEHDVVQVERTEIH